MPIPDYQTVMLPLLKLAADRQEHRIRDVVESLANHFELSEDERQEVLPSGKTSVFNSRVQWARTYLVKARLLEAPQRGVIRVTERGLEALRSHPDRVDNTILSQFSEFAAWREESQSATRSRVPVDPAWHAEQTPDEQLENAHQTLRASLAQDLLDRVKEASPGFFERLVLDLLLAMGYGGSVEDASTLLGKSGDAGIDGMIKEDPLGLDAVYIQAKRWSDGVVGRPEIQKFVGALQGQRAKKGVFITTSSFSNEARDYAANIESKVVLIEGQRLAGLMIDHDIGVSTVNTYVTKRIDTDYFAEE